MLRLFLNLFIISKSFGLKNRLKTVNNHSSLTLMSKINEFNRLATKNFEALAKTINLSKNLYIDELVNHYLKNRGKIDVDKEMILSFDLLIVFFSLNFRNL